MKKLITNILKAFFLLIILMPQITASAQRRFAPKVAIGESAFELTILNMDQTTDRTLEFDVYLLDANTADVFELATFQAGILLNASVFAGGTLSVSLVRGSSALNQRQSPEIIGFVEEVNGYPGLSLIKLASRGAPGAGNGTLLSGNRYGNCVVRIRLTGTIPFKANTSANLAFTSGTDLIPFYATRVAQYISSVNVQLEVIPGENAIVTGNPLLNPTITATGSGLTPGSLDHPAGSGMAGLMIFSYDKTVVIENRDNLTGEVAIYDLTGKEISSFKLINESRILIPVLADCGTYLVKVSSAIGIVSTKVFIH
ncbi:MAG: T9SS type A sorting domain-containing protein [Bacteroidota bacterium]